MNFSSGKTVSNHNTIIVQNLFKKSENYTIQKLNIMKRINNPAMIIVFLVGIVATFLACEKDDIKEDGGSGGSGKMVYMGKEYPVSIGYYETYGIYDGIHNYRLYIYSEGVNIETESGTGNAIAIYFSTYVAPLPIGTIPYYSETVDPVPTFEAEVVLEYNLDTEEGIRLSSFSEGELTITKSSEANTYSVQFNCISFGGEILSGQYSGKIFEF